MLKSKKIKIVDISAVDDTLIKNDAETVEEVLSEETNEIACISTDIKEEASEQTVVHEFKKTVKTTDSTECPNCHKMITNKTLKYSHSKTCGIVKKQPDTVTDIPNVIKQPNTINKISLKPRSLSPPKKQH